MLARGRACTLFPYTTLFRSSHLSRLLCEIVRLASVMWIDRDRVQVSDLRPVPGLLRLARSIRTRSEEHTSELQSLRHLVCRLLLEKKNSWLLREGVAS